MAESFAVLRQYNTENAERGKASATKGQGGVGKAVTTDETRKNHGYPTESTRRIRVISGADGP
ncbi:hypothetical protein ACSBLW_09720 [Thioclava sp. FR2]|uniref:hypothetical protein n=1 Tax=Thioclava sp. FR2 TaxID=3445780 RepID=UPI003EBCFF30